MKVSKKIATSIFVPMAKKVCHYVILKAPWHLLQSLLTIRSLLAAVAERTREMVLDGMKKVQQSFLEHDLVANVRLETYEGERYFHVPPPSK